MYSVYLLRVEELLIGSRSSIATATTAVNPAHHLRA